MRQVDRAAGEDVVVRAREELFGDLGTALDGWRCVEFAPSASVAHVVSGGESTATSVGTRRL